MNKSENILRRHLLRTCNQLSPLVFKVHSNQPVTVLGIVTYVGIPSLYKKSKISNPGLIFFVWQRIPWRASFDMQIES